MTMSGPYRAGRVRRWPSRHGPIVFLVVAVVAAGCGGSKGKTISVPPAASVTTVSGSASGYNLAVAQSQLPVGTSRFVFGILDQANNPITTGTPQVYVAKDQHSPAAGPFPAVWKTWSPPQGDTFGKPPIPGYFAAQVTVSQPGSWLIAATDTVNGKQVQATATMEVVTTPVAAVGSKAISERTPVATTAADLAKIDTRQPPTPMHYISLDAALANGKPTVLVFATPLLCQSRLCGPVVDEVLTAYQRVGAAKANFVDVEIYPSRDVNRPAPEFVRWGFQSEPWVLVIDATGVIRARFEGPSSAPEIQAALSPLLAP